MTVLGPYQVHPLAEALPLVEGAEFDELVNDIKANGLHEPIVLSNDGTVLIDGRNRYRACVEAGVDVVHRRLPAFYTEQQVLDLIVSKNLRRRQLTPGQLAMFALDYECIYAAAIKEAEAVRKREAIEGQRKGTPADLPESRIDVIGRLREAGEAAARVVGSAGRTVRQAKAVVRDAPDLAERVKTGELALDAADRARRERMTQYVTEMPPRAERGPRTTLTLRTHAGDAVEYLAPRAGARFNETPGDGISWAAWSWNPVTGCLHGCEYCYARSLATSQRLASAYPVGFTPLFHHERLASPANTVIPAQHRDDPAWQRVFVCSMADLYGRWVPDEWITQVHESMLASPQWQYLLLTKFPSRYIGLRLPPSAWVGTSVDEQKRVRIAEDAFRQIDGVKVKWLSLEPLREPLQFDDLSVFDWVVIGAQTETFQPTGRVAEFAPPFEWVARIVAQAREAGCRVHLKPNLLGRTSPQSPGMALPDEYPMT